MYVDNRQVPYRQQKCVSSIRHQCNDCVLSRIFQGQYFQHKWRFQHPNHLCAKLHESFEDLLQFLFVEQGWLRHSPHSPL